MLNRLLFQWLNRHQRLPTVLLLSMAIPGVACAQADYPNRPIRIVQPFQAGGLIDPLTRMVTKEMTARLGQPFVMDYKPGAGTNIAAAAVATAAPDGYTLLLATIASNALNKWTYKNLSYDPDKFASVGMIGHLASFLVVRKDSPFHSVADLVRAAKASPTGLIYGSHGNGGSNHLVTELFRQKAGIRQLLHVPYKGPAESHVDLLAGRIDFMIDSGAIVKVNQGLMRALAVTASQRWPTQPDVPTMVEAGYPDVTISTFYAFSAPPNTPEPILEKLNEAMRAAVRLPEMQKGILGLNVMPMTATRQETSDFIRQQSEKWGPMLRSMNIVFD